MGSFGALEIGLILAIVVLIFGVGKVADVGPALGKAISGFRREVKDEDDEEAEQEEEAPPNVEEKEEPKPEVEEEDA
jgi:sec-independent protein translocase protein TatA